MKVEDAHRGDLVQVDRLMTSGRRILAGPHLMKNRKHDARGIVLTVQPFSDGTGVVWVKHGGTVAPYWAAELKLIGVKAPDKD